MLAAAVMAVRVVSVRQTDGGVRLLAVSQADARAIERDPAMIDAVQVRGAVDIESDGRVVYAPTGPRWWDVDPEAREALLDVLEERE